MPDAMHEVAVAALAILLAMCRAQRDDGEGMLGAVQ
jgi:hypothetical protein